MAIHIGKRIKEELYHQGVSVSAFAKKINRSRNVVYDIFRRESIDTALLNNIGLILHFDFFALYSEQKEYRKEKLLSVGEDEIPSYKSPTEQLKLQEQQINKQLDEIAYLKKIVDLLEEKNKELTAASKKQ